MKSCIAIKRSKQKTPSPNKRKFMTQKTKGGDYIIWQNDPEDSVAEKSILIEVYTDVISITQEDRSINLNYESVDELCKLLKQIKRQP